MSWNQGGKARGGEDALSPIKDSDRAESWVRLNSSNHRTITKNDQGMNKH